MVPLIELRDVSYRLDGDPILSHINWRIEEGQHWVVLGPNGAGKTTLLRLLSGELWPNDGGAILRHGSDHYDLRVLRRRIGWLTSSSALRIPPTQTANDTVLAGAFAQTRLIEMPWERPTESQRQKAGEALDRLGAAKLKHREFGTLSHGEQQRVLIARALLAQPELLILDELSLGLDPGARERLLAALEVLARAGKPTLIITTHHPEEIMPSFARTLLLKQGRCLVQGRTQDVLTEQHLAELYGLRFSLIRQGGRVHLMGDSEAPPE